MCGYEVVQTERLGSLRANELVAGNACGGGETVVALKNSLSTFYACYGIAIFLTNGNVRRNDVLRQQRAHGIVYKYEVVVLYASLLQSIDSIVYRLLSVLATIEYPFQLGHHKLVGIRLQHSLPTIEANHRDAVDVGMPLEGEHRVNNNRTVVNMHKLLWYVLPHAVAGASGYYQCVIHIQIFFRTSSFSSFLSMFK